MTNSSEMQTDQNSLPIISIDKQAQSVVFHTAAHGSFQYQPGDVVGNSYRLLSLIGQGGVGVVYRAQHTIIGQHYALKLLAPAHVNTKSWRRFEVEGRALARLKHDNIVTIFNMGIDREQCPYYVMDWLAGISLAERIKGSGALSLSDALPIFLQICNGLSYAHRSGIIHRDIKPANIMLIPTPAGELRVKIVDFGMASLSSSEGEHKQALTALGEIFGSPLYMSPEQTLGQKMDSRSDIYSLGCTFFEALTAVVPFRGATAIETMLMHQEADIPAMALGKRDTEYSDMENLVSSCLQKDKERRYQSIDEIICDLKKIQQDLQGAGQLENRSGLYRQSDSSNISSYSEDSQSSQDASFGADKQKNFPWILTAITLSLVAISGIAWGFYLLLNSPKSKGVNHSSQVVRDLAPLKIAATGEQEVAAVLAAAPAVSSGVANVGGKKMRLFHLPERISICELSSDRSDGKRLGKVAFPFERAVSAQFFSMLHDYPAFVDKISPDDISILRLDDVSSAEQVLTRLNKWDKLSTLTLCGGDVASSGLRALDQLKSLRELYMKTTDFDWKIFSQLNCLKRLRTLQIENCSNINELLQNLPVMPELQSLHLRGEKKDWLKMEGLRAVSRQNSVTTMYLTTKEVGDQVFTQEVNADIEKEFPKIRRGKADFFHPEMINVFASMKNLKSLQISKPDWPDAEIARLLKEVPAARVNDWAKRFR